MGFATENSNIYKYSHFGKKKPQEILLLSKNICLNAFHKVKIKVTGTWLGHALGQLKFWLKV